MSCEGHRAQYFDHLAENLEGVNASQLEKIYQAACNQPNGEMEELAELKTRLLFGDMQGLGIKPPTHSASGLPKKKSQHGYAAIYNHLKQQGYFERKKNGRKPSDNGKTKPKREPLPPKQFKAKIAQTLQGQSGKSSEKPQKTQKGKAEGQTGAIAPERAEAITQQAHTGLSFVGLTEAETAEHVARFPVWKYLPRCGKCGRWMSTQNPVCQNPKCGLAGQQQGDPIPWPPPGANFKKSRVQAPGFSEEEDPTHESSEEGHLTEVEPALLNATEDEALSVDEPLLEGHDHESTRESPSLDKSPTRIKPDWVTAGQWVTERETGKSWWLASVDENGSMNLSEDPEALPMRATLLFDEYEPREEEITPQITEEELETVIEEIEEEVLDDLDALADETLETTPPTGHDYQITDADALGKGGAKTKARANLEAIKLIKQLEEEGRMATPEEQAILVKFVGWGGLPGVFDRRNEWYNPDSSYGMYRDKPEFYDEYQELKELLTTEEWNAASRSTVNAHYTSATVVKGVWDALKHMGYDQTNGTVLEPASGTGHFFGLMPETFKGSNKVAVELDPFTARIAKQLYQNADVRNSGFEATTLPNDYFDLAISNVPFGNFPVVDKDFLGARRFLTRSIHNFFFAKALDKVKPGGTVAFITSRYTLDSKDDSIRKYLAEHADLVGALRLPNTAFKENAGTEVTTDIIFLRKRLPDEEPKDMSWVDTEVIPGTDGSEIRVNGYFAKNREMMLGNLTTAGRMYGNREVTLEGDGRDLAEALQDGISRLPEGVLAAPQGRCPACAAFLDKEGQCNNPRCPKNRPVETRRVLPDEGMMEGQYTVQPEGVYRMEEGQLVPHEKHGQTTADGKEPMEIRRIRGLVVLNQAARKVLKMNVEEAEDAELTAAQLELNQAYDAFVQEHGPVNSKANQRALSGDPNLPFLMALEADYDSEKNTAKKEAIFAKRVISINKTVEKADSPQDALRVALNETGLVNWERMADLTGQSVERLQKALLADGNVFQTPTGTWETAEEYLSGNVRVKLREAEAAAALNPAYQRNVEALMAVVPRDLDATEIKAPLGSPWIPTEDIAAFAKAMLRADFNVSYVASLAEWKVKPESKNRYWGYDKNSALASQTWGTNEVDALKLLEQALNGQEPTVYMTISEEGKEKRVVNQNATIAAREQQAKIKAEFEKWLFTSDDERTERLVHSYNDLYNAEVPRVYDGSHLTLPGMGANMPELRPHQKDAVWRISQGENTLLAHIVGAGKTYSMIGGSMELRRTGLRKKPMHAIPNHMLEQYTADFYRMYPAAKLLAISAEDLTPKKRALTMSRIATGDWDAVIVTHSALSKLPVKPESEAEFTREQIEGIREALEAARQEGEKITVKELEKKLAREEAKLQEKLVLARDKQDNTITWDELGVDQLIVDEADLFKNLDFATRRTRLAGVQGQASSRAQDLFMKIRVMKKKSGDDQSTVFATGTPIANSVSEMYNMQRFLDYDHLKELGLAHFDNWASQFGEVVTSIEMKPSGGGYQTKSRFAQFNNVPELKRLFMRFADVQNDADELNLKRPKLEADEEGHRRQQGVAVPASDELKSYIKELVSRAENLQKVDPREDNMLKITSDGRKAALDMRLIDPYAEDNPNSKLNQAVENVFGIYQKTTGMEVPGMKGKQNMAQMIFCDLGTPNNTGFNAYADIKRKLVARGVKPEEIAFMQDCKKDEDKFDLFQKVNEGKVRVLIGSTETMGAGTNAQRRLAALHHLDAPWRPRDVEQREGRILRQGNLNEEVGVYRYLTEESFDVYNWQLLERKARFIAQVMNRDLNDRSVEDIDAKALTYAEMKALATGNPAVIEKVAVDAELRKLGALETAYKQRTFDQRVKLEKLPREITETQERVRKATASRAAIVQAQAAEAARETRLKAEIEEARAWAKQTHDEAKTLGKREAKERAETAKLAAQGKAERFKRNGAFSITLQGRTIDERDTAGSHLAALESDLMRTPAPNGETEEVGEFMGFPLLVQPPKVVGGEVKFFLKLTDEEAQYILPNRETGRTFEPDGGSGSGNITRIKRALNYPEKRIEEGQNQLAGLEKELSAVQASAGGGFEHQERLDFLRNRVMELDGILNAIGGDRQAVAE